MKRPQTQYLSIRKQDGSWTKSEKETAETFVTHLSKVFKHNPREITLEKENKFFSDSTTLDNPTRSFIIKEVRAVIKN
jgi:hypothetical protein